MKMAQLVMQCGYNKTVGICVDVHVHNICNKLGWVDSKNPERTRVALESWLPQKYWKEINYLLVGLGQMLQQDKQSLIQCCLSSTRPVAALKLVDTLGLDFRKFKNQEETTRTLAGKDIPRDLEQFLKKEGV